MKKQSVIFSLAILGIFSVLTLSSFFKPDQKEFEISNDDNTSFSSNSKSSQQRGNLNLSTSFENDYYTRNHRQGHFYAELVSGKYEQGSDDKHIPLNISVVIDRSGSMAGDKIRNAKLAAKYIVDQMQPDDYLSIVIYDGTVDILQSSITVQNKQMIKNKIDQITDRGGTNLMGGALEGYAQVKRRFKHLTQL